jgi:taurine--2-oxoglutarate transaminase
MADVVESRGQDQLVSGLDADERRMLAELDRRYVIQPWAASQARTRRHVVEWAQGSWIRVDGRDLLDFSAQTTYMNIGHRHPRVLDAIRRQLDVLPVAWSRLVSEPRARLAERLSGLAPGDDHRVFFTPGGAEAVEAAIMAAREFTGRRKILTHYRDYHGGTTGAIAASGDQRGWQPLADLTSIIRIPGPYPYRCSICLGPCSGSCVAYVEDVIRLEGPNSIAAILFEPIQGTNGVIIPPDSYLPRLRAIADRYGILLIADEVITGFGRTGTWFSMEHWGVAPDIIAVAKGLNAGYVPLGAAILSSRVAAFYDDHPWLRGHTYTGHALAAVSALAVMDVIEDEQLLDNSTVLGTYLLECAQQLAAAHPSVGEVRGKGLFVGIELVRNRATREPLYDWSSGRGGDAKGRVIDALLEAGVFMLEGNDTSLILAPPLNIARSDIDFAVGAIDTALTVSDREGET